MQKIINEHLLEHKATLEQLHNHVDEIENIAKILINALRNKKTIF